MRWQFKIAVVVRDPFARLASHLQMIDRYNNPDHKERAAALPREVTDVFRQVRETDFSDAASIGRLLATVLPWGRAALHDMQVRFLTDSPRPPAYSPNTTVGSSQTDRAINNLRVFDHILTTEDIDRGMARVAAAFGQPPPEKVVRTNIGETGRPVDFRNPEIRAALAPWVQQDVRLYDYAKGAAEARQDL